LTTHIEPEMKQNVVSGSITKFNKNDILNILDIVFLLDIE